MDKMLEVEIMVEVMISKTCRGTTLNWQEIIMAMKH